MLSKPKSWFAFTTLYLALLLIPVLLYVFVYQGSRIDEVTMRNFRSLDAAAERIKKVMTTTRHVAKNHTFGVDRDLLADITNPMSDPDADSAKSSGNQPSDYAKAAAHALKEVIDKQSKGRAMFDIRSVKLKKPVAKTKCEAPTTSSITPESDECSRAVAPATEQVANNEKVPRDDCPSSLWHCRYAKPCSSGLSVSAENLVIHDCGVLRERNKKLYDMLRSEPSSSNKNGPKIQGGNDLIKLLDKFGIEISIPKSHALSSPMQHLSIFFDSYFIANDREEIIFAGGARADHNEYRPHRAGTPFVSFAKISDILLADGQSDLAMKSWSSDAEESEAHAHLTGHSTVRTVDVNGVELSVFIHPFKVNMSLSENDEDVSTWYVVGALPSSSVAKEAIRIRLGTATDAMLAIALLLALLPILRFWSAGDRSVLSRFNIYGIGASVIGAAALCTCLGWSTIVKYADSSLDTRLRIIAATMTQRFNDQIKRTIGAIRQDVDAMLIREHSRAHMLGEIAEGQAVRQSQKDAEMLYETHLLCDSDDGTPKDDVMILSSFLLDEDGVMMSCTQYRKRRSQKLDLAFRSYFKDPYVPRAHFAHDGGHSWMGGTPVLATIDSVVQGAKEVVISFATYGRRFCDPKEVTPCHPRKEGPVAAAVVRLPQIDDIILDRRFQYAVVNRSGATLFHSDDDRERVSNFLDDAGNDERVALALASGQAHTIDLQYDGMPIRAHFTRLHPSSQEGRSMTSDQDWILIVFGHYRFADSLSSLNTSLSIIAWLTTIISIFLLILALGAVRRALSQASLLPDVVATLADEKIGFVALVLGATGLAISLSWSEHAWLVGISLPILVAFFIYAFAWWHGDFQRSEEHCPRERGPFRVNKGALFVVASVVFCISVVPMFAWQAYLLGELDAGLERYLGKGMVDDIDRKAGDFRKYYEGLLKPDAVSKCEFLSAHFVGLGEQIEEDKEQTDKGECVTDVKKSKLRMDLKADGTEGGFRHRVFSWMRPIVAYSGRSEEIMRRSGRAQQEDEDAGTLDRDIQGWAVALAVLGQGVVLLLLSYSAIRTKLGHAKRISLLVPYCPGRVEDRKASNVRMMLLKRTDADMEQFLATLEGRSVVRVARRMNGVWQWVPKGRNREDAEPAGTVRKVHVVEDLRDVMVDGAKWLAVELERKRDEEMILCTDVVPGHHIGDGTLDGPEHVLKLGDDWFGLSKGLQIRSLCSGGVGCATPETCGCGTVRSGTPWTDALADEARMHRDLKPVACIVKKLMEEQEGDVRRSETKATSDDSGSADEPRTASPPSSKDLALRDMALRRFRAGALLRFKEIWAASSYDEQLQIVALARGGAPNIRQQAAISSLANRGVITTCDPIELKSKAFEDFVNHDLAHDSLDNWRRQGHGDWWRVTWLPLVILAGLGVMFFLNSNPEALGTLGAIGAALIAFVPVVTSLFRGGQTTLPLGGAVVGDQ